MKLSPQHFTLAELFANRLFRIPEYQRPYAWESRQREDLFSDIEEVHKIDQDHFMATVVALKLAERRRIAADIFSVVDLVDGQQRLTTLIILLKAIELALDPKSNGQGKVQRELHELLVKDDEVSPVLIQTNHSTSTVMSDYLRSGKVPDREGETKAEQNILDAARECAAFVARWKGKHDLLELVVVLRTRLSVIYHELDDEATVYRVFEVLNSRGLDVKWIDKLKSQLMASIFAHVDVTGRPQALADMHFQWQEIYRKLGLEPEIGDDALRFAATWSLSKQPNRIPDEAQSAAALIDKAGTKLKDMMAVVKNLRDVVDVIHDIDQNPRLRAVAKIGHARFLAAAIRMRGLPKASEAKLLKQWEKVTFRIFGLGDSDSRHKKGEYVRFGYRIIAEQLDAKKISEGLTVLGSSHDIDKVLKDIDWSQSYENWQESLRYLLFRYDEYLAKEAGQGINEQEWALIWKNDPSNSIEHIQPQSSKSRYVHHLGNLTMVTPKTNSSMRDQTPSQKADRYRNEGIRATRLVGKWIEKSGWNQDAVKTRAEEIEKFVRIEWGD